MFEFSPLAARDCTESGVISIHDEIEFIACLGQVIYVDYEKEGPKNRIQHISDTLPSHPNVLDHCHGYAVHIVCFNRMQTQLSNVFPAESSILVLIKDIVWFFSRQCMTLKVHIPFRRVHSLSALITD